MPTNSRFAPYAWGVVAFNLLVIVWGAFVRASGSGAGCGSHWPLCNGQTVPLAPEFETFVEFTHRATSGVALLLVFGLAVWAFRAFPKGHLARLGAVASVVFILIEALIGAGLVLFGLVKDDDSVARAVWLGVHLVNTFLLIAALALTAWWGSAAGEGARAWRGGPRAPRRLAWLCAASLAGVLVVGVSGAVAALGDTLFPAASLAEGFRQDFSETAHVLVRLRILHPALALAAAVLAVMTAVVALRTRTQVWPRRWAAALALLVCVQLAAGLLNLLLLAPVWLQLVHLLLADLLWLSLVLLTATALEGAEQEAADPARVGLLAAEAEV
ncbi:MAG TPA: COX15/CtaA family protein [Pyrinomonadaceae bacterium]|nr:COX15/CtaA family protein [Pyrinomonadaceae bacterium]